MTYHNRPASFGHPPPTPAGLDWDRLCSKSISAMNPPPEFLALATQPGITSFAGGVPETGQFPYTKLAGLYTEILNDPERRAAALQYAPSTGLLSLRDRIAQNMRHRGIRAGHDDILITSGAQQALDLIAKLLIDPGDLIAVTGPTFFAALDTFNAYSPRFATVDLHEDGLDMQQLRAALVQRPKFLYLIPEFQNPTGWSLPHQQRIEILKMAHQYGVPVIEDAAYDQLIYDGVAIPSLAELDQHIIGAKQDHYATAANVIYVNTFSKVIVPGIRTGWIAAPADITAKLAALKLSSDIHSSTLTQMVVDQFARRYLDEHIKTLRQAYKIRRDAMLTALARHMPEGIHWTKPNGGFFIWLTLPVGANTSALFAEVVGSHQVAFVPGNLSHPKGGCENALRLSFATAEPAMIEAGIKRLAEFLKSRAADGAPHGGERSGI